MLVDKNRFLLAKFLMASVSAIAHYMYHREQGSAIRELRFGETSEKLKSMTFQALTRLTTIARQRKYLATLWTASYCLLPLRDSTSYGIATAVSRKL